MTESSGAPESAGGAPPPGGSPTGPGGRVDLHLHSTASDGTDGPSAVMERVARAGLDGAALTDHDTVGGLEEARRAARRLGLSFLPGAELSANEPGCSIHILAFGFDPTDGDFLDFLDGWEEARLRRAEEMVTRLRRLGLDLRPEDVREQAEGGVITRAHVARAMVDRGLVSGHEAAFRKYLSRGRPGFVEKPPLRPPEVAERVKAAGGVTVVAHPGRSHDEEDLRRWASQGLDGVEVLHPSNDRETRERLDRLAEELGLLRSGGSDWHGPTDHRPQPGSEPVPLAWMEEIAERCRVAAVPSAGTGAR